MLPLLVICICSWMLRDWLAAAFHCDVLRIVLRLVSVAVLWFALPAVGYALVLPAIGFALLPVVGFALLGSFHHCSRSSMFFSCGPRTLVALIHSFHHRLFGCGSVCASSSESLCGSLHSVVRFWLLPTPLLSIAPLRD